MKILMLGRWLPFARRGIPVTREQRVARYLARNHQVTLAFVTDDPNPVGAVSALREEFGDLEFAVVDRGWKSLASAVSLVAGDSCTLAYARSAALATRLRDRARTEGFDLIHVSSSSMIQYALEADPAIPVTTDLGEVESRWWTRQARERSFPGANFFRTEAARLRLAEEAIVRRAACCIVASAGAARALETGDAPGPHVIASGVDVEYFIPALRLPAPVLLLLSPLGSEADVALAAEFCRAVMPAVRRRVPAARMLVVGRSMAPTARELTRIEGVEVDGAVSDIRPYLHRAALGVAPWTSGITLPTRILEAMCSGLPVLSTGRATEGLGARPGRDLVLEESPAGGAARIVELLVNPVLRGEIGGQAAAFVRSRFAWGLAVERIGAAVEGAISATRGAGAAAAAGIPRIARAEPA